MIEALRNWLSTQVIVFGVWLHSDGKHVPIVMCSCTYDHLMRVYAEDIRRQKAAGLLPESWPSPSAAES